MGLSQNELQEKRLNVSLKLGAARHHVHTDAARMQQVLWNILRNSIKFTEAGGTITLTTSNTEEGWIENRDRGYGHWHDSGHHRSVVPSPIRRVL